MRKLIVSRLNLPSACGLFDRRNNTPQK